MARPKHDNPSANARRVREWRERRRAELLALKDASVDADRFAGGSRVAGRRNLCLRSIPRPNGAADTGPVVPSGEVVTVTLRFDARAIAALRETGVLVAERPSAADIKAAIIRVLMVAWRARRAVVVQAEEGTP